MENNENMEHSTELNANMTICKACGNAVSKKAPNCPKCGNPIKKSKKGLGCAIGCLTPILVIVLIIAGFNISGSIKERHHEKSYNAVVDYIKNNGTYTNGDYAVSVDLNELLNTNVFTDVHTIYSCVDENDNIYFVETIDYEDGDSNTIKINCNREGAPHECLAKLGDMLSIEGDLTSFRNSTYYFSNVVLDDGGVGMIGKADDSSADWFLLTLNNVEQHIKSFDLGVTIYDLYGFKK